MSIYVYITGMGSSRWCKVCNTVHESPTGSKCQRLAMEQLPTDQEQAQNPSQDGDSTASGENGSAADSQAIAGTTSSPMKSMNNTDNSHAILYELQKMTSRFGQIEKQAAADRAVIAGLVKRLDEPGRVANISANTGQSTTQGSTTQKVTENTGQIQNSLLPQPSMHKQPIDPTFTQSGVTTEVLTNRGGANMQVPQGVYQVQMGRNGLEMRPVHGSGLKNNIGQELPTTHMVAPQQNAATSQLQSTIPGGSREEYVFGGARPKTGQQYSMANLAKNSTTCVPEDTMETRCKVQTQNATIQEAVAKNGGGFKNAGQTMEWDKDVIPTLNTLRQATDINQKVQERYRELEEANSHTTTGKFELLIDALIKDKKIDKKKIKWPQDQAFIGVMRKRPSYEHLTICQWLLGFLRIQQEETDITIRDNMVTYLCELMQDACDFTWESAKGAHAVLLHRMADGVVDWTQLKEINKIRKRYAQTNATTTLNDKKPNKVVPCIKFNKGMCTRGTDHEWQGLLLKHMCQFCFNSFNKIENHARKDCWKDQKENGKN